MANWKLFKIKEVSDGDNFFYKVCLDGRIPYSGGPGTYTNNIKIRKGSVPDKKYISVGSSIEINMTKVSNRCDLTTLSNVFSFSCDEVRRPEIETLREDLELANKEIEDLKKEQAGEREANVDYPKKQFNILRYNYSADFPELFSELEERVGAGNTNAENFIQLLLSKEGETRFEKRKIKRQKNKIRSKYQKQFQNLKNLVQSRKEVIDKNENLTENLLKKIGKLTQEQQKTKKLTKFKKMLTEAIQSSQTERTDLKSKFQTAQTEIKSLKTDKKYLEEKISLKKVDKKDLYAKIRELKKVNKEQTEELTTSKEKLTKQETTIQKLEKEKGNWEKKEQELLTKQNELLAEIELLKNPPLTNANKERVKQNTIVKEVIKEVFIKSLESNELGFKLTPSEKTKLNNLSLKEAENYHHRLIKSKFNHLESQVKNISIERERETKFLLLWLLIGLLVLISLNFVVKKIKRTRRLKKF